MGTFDDTFCLTHFRLSGLEKLLNTRRYANTLRARGDDFGGGRDGERCYVVRFEPDVRPARLGLARVMSLGLRFEPNDTTSGASETTNSRSRECKLLEL